MEDYQYYRNEQNKLLEPVMKQYKLLYKIISVFFVAVTVWAGDGEATIKHDSQDDSLVMRPNFVLIVIDDIGYNDLGFYGSQIHKTPNIDKLAEEGMVFTDFHTNGAVCSPTRASLMTGQYQQRSNVEHAIGFTMDGGMPLEKQTIAELLEKAGYRSGVFGKWHLGHVSKFGPNDQGFEQSAVSNNTPDYHTHISREGELDWYKNQVLFDESGYLTDLVTNHSVQFIDDNKEQPFFLFTSHIAAHFPFQGPDDPPHRTIGKIWHDTKYGPLPESQYRRAYKDMIEGVDKSVGEVVQALENAGLRENTLIFITSDNGAYSWVGSNYPYRGQKGDLYEGGHRVPAIANWPGHISPNTITDATTMTMDLAPTFASIAGVEFASERQGAFDGIDLSPVLFDEASIRERILFWRFINPYVNSHSYAVRQSGWKYIVENGKQFLFNLDMDQTESNNLMNKYPAIAKEMEVEYQNWLEEVER